MSIFKALQETDNYYNALFQYCKTSAEYLMDKGYIIYRDSQTGQYVYDFHLNVGTDRVSMPTHFFFQFVQPVITPGSFSSYGLSLCPPNPVLKHHCPCAIKMGQLNYAPFGYICKATMPRQTFFHYNLAYHSIERYLKSHMTDPPAEMICLKFTAADQDQIYIPMQNLTTLHLVPFKLDLLTGDESMVSLLEKALDVIQ